MDYLKTLTAFALVSTVSLADDPCRSGPQVNQRTGPYAALIAVGPQRGTSHCFICEAGEKPTVIIFARTLSDSVGKLTHQLDRALAIHKGDNLRIWVTFLSDDPTRTDPKVVEWSKQQATGSIPLGVYNDSVGPPSYLLSRDADVTVLLSNKQRVVANFAYRLGELNDSAVSGILKTLPRIVGAKK